MKHRVLEVTMEGSSAIGRNASSAVIIIVVTVIVLGGVIVLANNGISTDPDNVESETVCIYQSTTSTMIYHVGTMPLCPVSTNSSSTLSETPSNNSSSTNATNATFSSSEISNSTICMVAVEGNGVYLRIISDSNDSLSGINVLAVPKANSCPGSFIPYPFEQTSNAAGWVSLNFPNLQANYYYQASIIDYDGKNYSFVLPQGPLETTLALLSLPSGNLSIQLCQTLFDPIRFSCQLYANETNTFVPTITTVVTYG